MNFRASVIGLVGVAALVVATGSLGASPPAPSAGPTVTIQAAPGNGITTFPTLTLTMAQLAALPQTTVTIEGGATTETGPTVLSLLNTVAGFAPIAACKNDSLRYWIEAASLNGSAATVTDGEIDPGFGQNTTVLSLSQNGSALTAPRLAVSNDATDARDIPAVYNITIGRAPTVFASTTSACNPPSFTPVSPPSNLGDVVVSGDVSSPRTWSFAELGSSLFSQVSQTDSVGGKAKTEVGPTVYDVVSANNPTFPSGPNGRARGYVQATSSEDGSATLLSWAEVDPSLSGAAITSTCACKLLSLTENGVTVVKPTGIDNGPRVTAPGDNKAGRYDFGVQFMTYLNAPDIPLPAAGSGPNLSGNLKNTPLSNAWLVGATLNGNLNKADLHGSFLDNANLSGSNLNKSSFAGALLNGANLSGDNLNGADFSGANLTGADLRGSNLNGADFSGANLTGADLGGSNLNGVTWSNTVCPDGTNSNDDGGSCAGHI